MATLSLMPGHSKRLAEAVDKRRKELGFTTWRALQEAAGISSQGLKNVRNGERRNYQDRLTVPLTAALKWTPDSIERLLRGDDPLPVFASQPTAELVASKVPGGIEITEALTRAATSNDSLAAVAATVEILEPRFSSLIERVGRLEVRVGQLARLLQEELQVEFDELDDVLDSATLAEPDAGEAGRQVPGDRP